MTPMPESPGSAAVDEYIAGFPPEVQERLEQMRAIIRKTAPDAVETISYGIPTFDMNGRHLVHFGGFKSHVGFYPIPSAMEAFSEELAAYKKGKGSAQFPLDQPLPEDLVRRIVEFRLAETEGKTGK